MRKLLICLVLATSLTGCVITDNDGVPIGLNDPMESLTNQCKEFAGIDQTPFKYTYVKGLAGSSMDKTHDSYRSIGRVFVLENVFKFANKANTGDLTQYGKGVYLKYKKVKVITPSCEVAFIMNDFRAFDSAFTLIDGKKLSNDEFVALSDTKLNEIPQDLFTYKYDKFEKTGWIRSPSLGDSNFRAFVQDGKVTLIQLVISASSYGSWARYDRAYDLYDNRFDVRDVGADVDCSQYGCTHYESTAITLSKEYLTKYKDQGFDIQIKGTGGDFSVSVLPEVINGFFKSIKAHTI